MTGHQDDELKQRLVSAINEHGRAFQERCAYELRRRVSESWQVQDVDHPVRNLDRDTAADIVLKHKGRPSYVVIECKRQNPEYVGWLFYPRNDSEKPSARLFAAEEGQQSIGLNERPVPFARVQVHDWVSVSPKGRSGKVSNPDVPEGAIRQALHSTRGVAKVYMDQRGGSKYDTTYFVPVVVTTAPLYVAEYRTKDVSLKSGGVSEDDVHFGTAGTLEPEPYVLAHYGLTESIATNLIRKDYNGTDFGRLGEQKRASVFVVNAASMVSFFQELDSA